MASVLKVDKLDPQSGTALEIGTSGDTVTVPSGVGLTLTDSTLSLPTTINTDKIDPKSGTALEIGSSGDTISVPSGATLNISASTLTPPATMPASSGINFTALNATNLGSGTVPTARLGSGTASSTTILYGDQTYKTEPAAGFSPYGASAYSSATQSIPDAAWTKVTLGNEYTDTNGEFTGSTYTAVSAGDYIVSAQIYENGEAGGTVSFQTVIYKNGALFLRGAQTIDYGVGYTFPIAAVVVPLSASDYLELYCIHNKGSAMTINWDNSGTYLSAWRLK